MRHFLLKEIFQPLFRRAGTFVGSAAATAGLTTDVSQVEGAVMLLLGLAFDLGMSHLNRAGSK